MSSCSSLRNCILNVPRPLGPSGHCRCGIAPLHDDDVLHNLPYVSTALPRTRQRFYHPACDHLFASRACASLLASSIPVLTRASVTRSASASESCCKCASSASCSASRRTCWRNYYTSSTGTILASTCGSQVTGRQMQRAKTRSPEKAIQ